MLHFDGYRKALPLPAAREQRKLLLIVLLAGGVILLPQWLFQFGLFNAAMQPMDHGKQGGDARAVGEGTPPATGSETANSCFELKNRLGQIDFSDVQDDMPFRSREKDAWFAVFELLKAIDARTLSHCDVPHVTFSQLYRRPRDYRGQLVRVRGDLMRTVYYQAPPNQAGIEGYFQAWQRPERENDPIVIYCLTLPPGFPRGLSIQEPVEIVGVFFKRWAYQAQDQVRFAPVILAKEPVWNRPPAASQAASPTAPDFLVAVGISLFLAALIVFIAMRPRKRQKPEFSQVEDDSLSTNSI